MHLCFGTVIVDEESLPSGCSCFGVGFFVVPPPQAPWFVILLFALFRFGSVGCGSGTVLVGVTMFWSSSVCSPLLLFDACCLLFASSRSLLLFLSLDMVSQIFISGLAIFE